MSLAEQQSASRLRRALAHPVTRIVLELAIFLGMLVAVKAILIKPGLGLLGLSENVFRAWQGGLTIAAMFAVYVILIRVYEKRAIHELTINRLIPDGIAGLVSATVIVSCIFWMLYLFDAYRIISSGTLAAMIVPGIWVILLAIMEEMMFRGILYRNLEEWLGTIAALILSASLFGLSHLPNEHADAISVISAGIGGLLMGALYSLTRRLWVPIFFHASWNFTQAIFGSTVSGSDLFGSYYESVREGPEWLTGGPFGVENSIITLVLLSCLIVPILLRIKSQNNFVKSRRSVQIQQKRQDKLLANA